jgi:hypothetical protein
MVGPQNEPVKSLRLAIGRFNRLWQRGSHRRASSYLPAPLCTTLVDLPGISTPPDVSSWSEMLSIGAAFMVDGPSVKPCVCPVATPLEWIVMWFHWCSVVDFAVPEVQVQGPPSEAPSATPAASLDYVRQQSSQRPDELRYPTRSSGIVAETCPCQRVCYFPARLGSA